MRRLHIGKMLLNLNLISRIFICIIKDKCGVTAIEYALIAALIAVAAIAAMQLVGTGLINTFNSIATQL